MNAVTLRTLLRRKTGCGVRELRSRDWSRDAQPTIVFPRTTPSASLDVVRAYQQYLAVEMTGTPLLWCQRRRASERRDEARAPARVGL